MLKQLRPIVLYLAIGLLATGCNLFRKEAQQPLVTVNDVSLTTETFAEQLAQKMKRFDAIEAKNPQNLKTAKESIIDDFIQTAIVQSWADRSNISVSSEELDTAIDSYRKQYPDDVAMKQALSDAGISFDEWRLGLKNILLQKKVFESIKPKITEPTEQDLKSYYESNKEEFAQKAMIRIRQVVLNTEDEAQRLFDQLNKNSNLSELAKQFSITPEAVNGGDTGWVAKGTLEIFDKAFAWPTGKRSPVLKSPYGFHIFEVIGKKPESQLKFEEARDSISKLMRADREQAAYSAWLEEQLKLARVFRNDDLINSISVVTRGEK